MTSTSHCTLYFIIPVVTSTSGCIFNHLWRGLDFRWRDLDHILQILSPLSLPRPQVVYFFIFVIPLNPGCFFSLCHDFDPKLYYLIFVTTLPPPKLHNCDALDPRFKFYIFLVTVTVTSTVTSSCVPSSLAWLWLQVVIFHLFGDRDLDPRVCFFVSLSWLWP
jgi:hypothetical protein